MARGSSRRPVSSSSDDSEKGRSRIQVHVRDDSVPGCQGRFIGWRIVTASSAAGWTGLEAAAETVALAADFDHIGLGQNLHRGRLAGLRHQTLIIERTHAVADSLDRERKRCNIPFDKSKPR